MTNDKWLSRLWTDIAGFLLPTVTLLSIVLGWPTPVQVTLSVIFFAAMIHMRVELERKARRR